MLESLNRRYAKVVGVPFVVLACSLYPRYKNHAFTFQAKKWLNEDIQHLEESSATEVDNNMSTEETQEEGISAASCAKRSKVDQPQGRFVDKMYDTLFGKHTQATSSTIATLEDKLYHYLRDPAISHRNGNPLDWWKQNLSRFPALAEKARKYLTAKNKICTSVIDLNSAF